MTDVTQTELSTANSSMATNSNVTVLEAMLNATTGVPTDMTSVNSTFPPITSQTQYDDVTQRLSHNSSVSMTTDSSVIYETTAAMLDEGLTPMQKWFIATGAVIAAVVFLMFINCFIHYGAALKKLLGFEKKHVSGEKRVRRDHLSLVMEDGDAPHETHTHVLLNRVLMFQKARHKE